MNEAETRAELSDPVLQAAGWSAVEGCRVRRGRQDIADRWAWGRHWRPAVEDQCYKDEEAT